MKRIPSLDGLRALSILLVVFGHMAKSGHAPRVLWSAYATVGVQMFFVISGFLITGLLIEERELTGGISLRRFYFRRACRIFPAAFVFLAIATIFFWRELTWIHISAAILYVANFDELRPWIFGHLWSLSVEEQFYLLWPTILRKFYQRRILILTAVIVLAPCLQALFYFARIGGGNVGAYPWAASNLAFGCLLAVLKDRLPHLRTFAAIPMLLAIIGIPLFAANTAVKTLLMTFALQPLFYVSLAGILIHVVQTPYRVLNNTAIMWLGKISYSLYLWQQPFCSNPHLRHGYSVVFAFLMASFSYYIVERPILRWRDRCEHTESGRRPKLAHVAAASEPAISPCVTADGLACAKVS